MRIAVTSRNFRTITPHAGVTRRFLVYEVEHGEAPREVDRLDLASELAIRNFDGSGQHPLDGVDAVIVGGSGPGFVRRMAARGVAAVVTSQTDPIAAVASYVAGTLPTTMSADREGSAGSEVCYGVLLRSRRRARRREQGRKLRRGGPV